MLRITFSENDASQQWNLQGWLIGPWVNELRMSWESSRESRGGRTCLVNVSDLICMDSSGESLCEEMLAEGAQIIGCGVYTKHLLTRLGKKKGHQVST